MRAQDMTPDRPQRLVVVLVDEAAAVLAAGWHPDRRPLAAAIRCGRAGSGKSHAVALLPALLTGAQPIVVADPKAGPGVVTDAGAVNE
jgi:pantothenate kinase-related protein Tda10